jgi:anti-sigma-K factor RskA
VTHEQWQESAAAYALDALEEQDRAAFESHLGECAECRLAVQSYREIAGLLVHAAPATPAPPGLARRVGELVAAEAGNKVAKRSIAPRSIMPWLLAAASVVIAITGITLARRAAARDAVALQARVDSLTMTAAARDSLLTSLTGPEVHVVSLAAGTAKPVARVFWNHIAKKFIVTAFDLPPAQPGRTYQLWAISNGKAPVSMGTFTTDDNGDASVVLPVTAEVEALGFIDVCALTEEPAGGSPGPTETPRLMGPWRHTD